MESELDYAKGFVSGALNPLRYGGQTPVAGESPALILSQIPAGSRVLDVGCGTGAISQLIRHHCSAEVIGLEPHAGRAEAARATGLEVITGLFTAPAVAHLGKFDIVVFADVLEHLVAPAEALELAKTLLRPGGSVVTSVPNIAHWSVRMDLLRGRFNYRDVGIMDATHVRWFTRETLQRLFVACGFRVDWIGQSAGLWMSDYEEGLWGCLRPGLRRRIVERGLRFTPGLFACQFVLKATAPS